MAERYHKTHSAPVPSYFPPLFPSPRFPSFAPASSGRVDLPSSEHQQLRVHTFQPALRFRLTLIVSPTTPAISRIILYIWRKAASAPSTVAAKSCPSRGARISSKGTQTPLQVERIYCRAFSNNLTRSSGFTRARSTVNPQCRCGPVTRPVAPTFPSTAPVSTLSPAFTSISERCP